MSAPSAPMRVFAVVFVAYLAGAVASALAFGSTTASAFFVPGGITVAAMLLTRRSLWPVILVALVIAELIVDRVSGLNWPVSAGFALGNAAEALAGAAVVRAWCGGTPDLRRTRDLIIYVLGAAGVGALCGALIGGLTKFWAFGVPPLQGMTQWFAGDAISVLTIGASILLWSRQSDILRSRPLETAAILLAAALGSVIAFGAEILPATTTLPVLAVAALRLGVLGTALTGVVIAAIGNYMTGTRHGLLGHSATADPLKVALAQVFVAVLVLTAMVIAQEVARRTSAVAERDVERGERLRLESLSGLAQDLSAALTPSDVGAAIERRLAVDFGATAFSLSLINQDSGQLEKVASAGNLSDSPAGTDVVRSAVPVVLDNDSGSVAAWPLFSGDRVAGVLKLGFAGREDFELEQFTYFSAVGAMVGEALARAQSYADEHARAVVLHAALHPASPPATSGIQYCVCYEPADIVHGLGGDFYDVMSLPGNRTYLAVGDIVGHGLAAVEDMAQLRSAGRTLAHRGQSPAQVLADLNGFTEEVIRSEFATMVAAVFDRATGSLTYSSAGHPPALLRKAATGEVILLTESNGPVLGPVRRAAYTDTGVRIDSGDILVLYTDGLVERPGLVVSEGIARAARLVAEWPADDVLNCQAIADHLVPAPRLDDVCVLVVRFD